MSWFLYSEPSRPLHLATLCSVLTGVINWNGLGHRLGVPRSKRAAIEFPLDRHTTVAEGRNAMIKEWLESDHLIPSWRGLARALYRRGEVAEHDALQSVYERYLPGMSGVQWCPQTVYTWLIMCVQLSAWSCNVQCSSQYVHCSALLYILC